MPALDKLDTPDLELPHHEWNGVAAGQWRELQQDSISRRKRESGRPVQKGTLQEMDRRRGLGCNRQDERLWGRVGRGKERSENSRKDVARAAHCMNASKLAAAKDRVWFYEFELPDGTRTRAELPPEILRIHTSRRATLGRIIRDQVKDSKSLSALDLASHQGYFSAEMAKHFDRVHGLEFRAEHVEAARLIADVLALRNVTFNQADLQKMDLDKALCADFVLVYGLMYHLEDPIHALRLASELCRKHILIETQVFPYDISGRIEDGYYQEQRAVHGVFSLSVDSSSNPVGGSTDLALVPSLNALLFLLKTFGFREVTVLEFDPTEYEQFRRGARVVVYGRK